MIEPAPAPASPVSADAAIASGPLDREIKVRKLGWFLAIGQLVWTVPSGIANVLLAAVIADVDPAHKIAIFTGFAVAGAVTSAVGTVVGGLLSDRTKSRLGRRAPWLIVATVLVAITVFSTGFTSNLLLLGILFAISQLGIGAYVAVLAALIPDHVGAGSIGRASAFGGFGYLIGQTVGGIFYGSFVTNPHLGLMLAPWIMVVGAVIVVLGVRGRDSRGIEFGERAPFRIGDILPKAGRDFWLAFLGRFLFILAILMVITFELYLLTDFIGLSTADAGRAISLGTLLVGGLSLVGVVLSGVLSDRTHRIKPFVIVTPIILAVGLIPLLIAPGIVTIFIFFGAIGLTLGSYLAVDQALMVAVLPNPDNAARDLGFLSIGSTLPGVVAPLVGGLVAGAFGYGAVFIVALVLAAAAAGVIFGIRKVK
jgi:MFS family permease